MNQTIAATRTVDQQDEVALAVDLGAAFEESYQRESAIEGVHAEGPLHVSNVGGFTGADEDFNNDITEAPTFQHIPLTEQPTLPDPEDGELIERRRMTKDELAKVIGQPLQVSTIGNLAFPDVMLKGMTAMLDELTERKKAIEKRIGEANENYHRAAEAVNEAHRAAMAECNAELARISTAKEAADLAVGRLNKA